MTKCTVIQTIVEQPLDWTVAVTRVGSMAAVLLILALLIILVAGGINAGIKASRAAK